MNHRKYLLMGLLVACFIVACGGDEEMETDFNSEASPGLKIMSLGASRVEGARPFFESFRYELWKQMVAAGWAFDYIGTVEDEASYPAFNERNFDLDHEGRGGWTSGQILSGLEGWIQATGIPDIVLFSSPAGNDALQNLDYEQSIANVNAIIDLLQEVNPNVVIIVEQLAPGKSEIMTGDLLHYFNRIQSDILTIAAAQSTTTSTVTGVDMFTGFTDDLLADDVHYNEAGAKFIADRYFIALETYFP